ncbi:MAG: 50S ribosomal protein L35 [Alphaproteobacteria bacterium]|nr:50S ribosomal protein L35 [Alphaproteobacteria bacterium]
MPKLKTKSSVKKRFSKTGSGKIKRNYAHKKHNLSSKSQKMKRSARGTVLLDATNYSNVIRFMPYA